MPIKPTKAELRGGKEGKNKFISRCIKQEKNSGYDEDQAAAICYRYWRKAKSGKK
jgi:hypothetical protein